MERTPVNRVHDLNTGEDFIFIQDAIDDADTEDGHTIVVDDGVYRENVRVTKSLTIRSLNGSANCVIQDARRDDHAADIVGITADHVSMSGFTLKRLPESEYGAGIHLYASFCNVSGNNCSNNAIGICLADSSDNIISGNDCSNNWWAGIGLYESCNNVIYLNNFINNAVYTGGIGFSTSTNIWNSLSTINYTYDGSAHSNHLGNYWSNYKGSDSDNDGIGDSPYRIDHDRDNYPLVIPIENYSVETENVQEQSLHDSPGHP